MSLDLHNFSATTIPAKLIASGCVKDCKILPMHPSLYTTNRCNLKCAFCNTQHLDKASTWSREDTAKIVEMLTKFGTKAVTLSGGGEPLIFTHFNYLLDLLCANDIQIGVITNGRLLQCIPREVADRLTWVRISIHAYNKFTSLSRENLCWVMGTKAFLSFRYIYQSYEDIPDLLEAAKFAEEHGRTLLVSGEIFKHTTPELTKETLERYRGTIIAEDKMSVSTRGALDCWHGLLKPVIAADGYVYPCCLVGFPDKILDRAYALCHYSEYPAYVASQVPFNGSKCNSCNYDNYNKYLSCYKKTLLHPRFI